MAKRSTSGCRLRKVACTECGYTARITRSWLEVGLPSCPCGGTLEPTDAGDRAFIGLIGPESMSQGAWNAICRSEGWDIVRNQGQAARRLHESVVHAPSKPQCMHPGCGKWTRAGETHCNDHQPAELAAMPF